MLKKLITKLILSYAAQYLNNVHTDRLSLWEGDIVLQHLDLKLDLISRKLNLPHEFELSRGFVKELRITVPWNVIRSEAVKVQFNFVEIVVTHRNQYALALSDGSPIYNHSVAAAGPIYNHALSCLLARGYLVTVAEIREKTVVGSIVENQNYPSASVAQTWFQSLFFNILTSVEWNVKNLVIKYVCKNNVVSMTVGDIYFNSIGESCETNRTQDIKLPIEEISRALFIQDLTICLDFQLIGHRRSTASRPNIVGPSRKNRAKTERPLLHRWSGKVHLSFPLIRSIKGNSSSNSPGIDVKPTSLQIGGKFEPLHVNVSSGQLDALWSIYKCCGGYAFRKAYPWEKSVTDSTESLHDNTCVEDTTNQYKSASNAENGSNSGSRTRSPEADTYNDSKAELTSKQSWFRWAWEALIGDSSEDEVSVADASAKDEGLLHASVTQEYVNLLPHEYQADGSSITLSELDSLERFPAYGNPFSFVETACYFPALSVTINFPTPRGCSSPAKQAQRNSTMAVTNERGSYPPLSYESTIDRPHMSIALTGVEVLVSLPPLKNCIGEISITVEHVSGQESDGETMKQYLNWCSQDTASNRLSNCDLPVVYPDNDCVIVTESIDLSSFGTELNTSSKALRASFFLLSQELAPRKLKLANCSPPYLASLNADLGTVSIGIRQSLWLRLSRLLPIMPAQNQIEKSAHDQECFRNAGEHRRVITDVSLILSSFNAYFEVMELSNISHWCAINIEMLRFGCQQLPTETHVVVIPELLRPGVLFLPMIVPCFSSMNETLSTCSSPMFGGHSCYVGTTSLNSGDREKYVERVISFSILKFTFDIKNTLSLDSVQRDLFSIKSLKFSICQFQDTERIEESSFQSLHSICALPQYPCSGQQVQLYFETFALRICSDYLRFAQHCLAPAAESKLIASNESSLFSYNNDRFLTLCLERFTFQCRSGSFEWCVPNKFLPAVTQSPGVKESSRSPEPIAQRVSPTFTEGPRDRLRSVFESELDSSENEEAGTVAGDFNVHCWRCDKDASSTLQILEAVFNLEDSSAHLRIGQQELPVLLSKNVNSTELPVISSWFRIAFCPRTVKRLETSVSGALDFRGPLSLRACQPELPVSAVLRMPPLPETTGACLSQCLSWSLARHPKLYASCSSFTLSLDPSVISYVINFYRMLSVLTLNLTHLFPPSSDSDVIEQNRTSDSRYQPSALVSASLNGDNWQVFPSLFRGTLFGLLVLFFFENPCDVILPKIPIFFYRRREAPGDKPTFYLVIPSVLWSGSKLKVSETIFSRLSSSGSAIASRNLVYLGCVNVSTRVLYAAAPYLAKSPTVQISCIISTITASLQPNDVSEIDFALTVSTVNIGGPKASAEKDLDGHLDARSYSNIYSTAQVIIDQIAFSFRLVTKLEIEFSECHELEKYKSLSISVDIIKALFRKPVSHRGEHSRSPDDRSFFRDKVQFRGKLSLTEPAATLRLKPERGANSHSLSLTKCFVELGELLSGKTTTPAQNAGKGGTCQNWWLVAKVECDLANLYKLRCSIVTQPIDFVVYLDLLMSICTGFRSAAYQSLKHNPDSPVYDTCAVETPIVHNASSLVGRLELDMNMGKVTLRFPLFCHDSIDQDDATFSVEEDCLPYMLFLFTDISIMCTRDLSPATRRDPQLCPNYTLMENILMVNSHIAASINGHHRISKPMHLSAESKFLDSYTEVTVDISSFDADMPSLECFDLVVACMCQLTLTIKRIQLLSHTKPLSSRGNKPGSETRFRLLCPSVKLKLLNILDISVETIRVSGHVFEGYEVTSSCGSFSCSLGETSHTYSRTSAIECSWRSSEADQAQLAILIDKFQISCVQERITDDLKVLSWPAWGRIARAMPKDVTLSFADDTQVKNTVKICVSEFEMHLWMTTLKSDCVRFNMWKFILLCSPREFEEPTLVCATHMVEQLGTNLERDRGLKLKDIMLPVAVDTYNASISLVQLSLLSKSGLEEFTIIPGFELSAELTNRRASEKGRNISVGTGCESNLSVHVTPFRISVPLHSLAVLQQLANWILELRGFVDSVPRNNSLTTNEKQLCRDCVVIPYQFCLPSAKTPQPSPDMERECCVCLFPSFSMDCPLALPELRTFEVKYSAPISTGAGEYLYNFIVRFDQPVSFYSMRVAGGFATVGEFFSENIVNVAHASIEAYDVLSKKFFTIASNTAEAVPPFTAANQFLFKLNFRQAIENPYSYIRVTIFVLRPLSPFISHNLVTINMESLWLSVLYPRHICDSRDFSTDCSVPLGEIFIDAMSFRFLYGKAGLAITLSSSIAVLDLYDPLTFLPQPTIKLTGFNIVTKFRNTVSDLLPLCLMLSGAGRITTQVLVPSLATIILSPASILQLLQIASIVRTFQKHSLPQNCITSSNCTGFFKCPLLLYNCLPIRVYLRQSGHYEVYSARPGAFLNFVWSKPKSACDNSKTISEKHSLIFSSDPSVEWSASVCMRRVMDQHTKLWLPLYLPGPVQDDAELPMNMDDVNGYNIALLLERVSPIQVRCTLVPPVIIYNHLTEYALDIRLKLISNNRSDSLAVSENKMLCDIARNIACSVHAACNGEQSAQCREVYQNCERENWRHVERDEACSKAIARCPPGGCIGIMLSPKQFVSVGLYTFQDLQYKDIVGTRNAFFCFPGSLEFLGSRSEFVSGFVGGERLSMGHPQVRSNGKFYCAVEPIFPQKQVPFFNDEENVNHDALRTCIPKLLKVYSLMTIENNTPNCLLLDISGQRTIFITAFNREEVFDIDYERTDFLKPYVLPAIERSAFSSASVSSVRSSDRAHSSLEPMSCSAAIPLWRKPSLRFSTTRLFNKLESVSETLEFNRATSSVESNNDPPPDKGDGFLLSVIARYCSSTGYAVAFCFTPIWRISNHCGFTVFMDDGSGRTHGIPANEHHSHPLFGMTCFIARNSLTLRIGVRPIDVLVSTADLIEGTAIKWTKDPIVCVTGTTTRAQIIIQNMKLEGRSIAKLELLLQFSATHSREPIESGRINFRLDIFSPITVRNYTKSDLRFLFCEIEEHSNGYYEHPLSSSTIRSMYGGFDALCCVSSRFQCQQPVVTNWNIITGSNTSPSQHAQYGNSSSQCEGLLDTGTHCVNSGLEDQHSFPYLLGFHVTDNGDSSTLFDLNTEALWSQCIPLPLGRGVATRGVINDILLVHLRPCVRKKTRTVTQHASVLTASYTLMANGVLDIEFRESLSPPLSVRNYTPFPLICSKPSQCGSPEHVASTVTSVVTYQTVSSPTTYVLPPGAFGGFPCQELRTLTVFNSTSSVDWETKESVFENTKKSANTDAEYGIRLCFLPLPDDISALSAHAPEVSGFWTPLLRIRQKARYSFSLPNEVLASWPSEISLSALSDHSGVRLEAGRFDIFLLYKAGLCTVDCHFMPSYSPLSDSMYDSPEVDSWDAPISTITQTFSVQIGDLLVKYFVCDIDRCDHMALHITKLGYGFQSDLCRASDNTFQRLCFQHHFVFTQLGVTNGSHSFSPSQFFRTVLSVSNISCRLYTVCSSSSSPSYIETCRIDSRKLLDCSSCRLSCAVPFPSSPIEDMCENYTDDSYVAVCVDEALIRMLGYVRKGLESYRKFYISALEGLVLLPISSPPHLSQIALHHASVVPLLVAISVRLTTPVFVSLSGFRLTFPSLELHDVFTTSQVMYNELLAHFTAFAILKSPSLLASLDLLGNPRILYSRLKRGVRDVLENPLSIHGFWSFFKHGSLAALSVAASVAESISMNLPDAPTAVPRNASNETSIGATVRLSKKLLGLLSSPASTILNGIAILGRSYSSLPLTSSEAHHADSCALCFDSDTTGISLSWCQPMIPPIIFCFEINAESGSASSRFPYSHFVRLAAGTVVTELANSCTAASAYKASVALSLTHLHIVYGAAEYGDALMKANRTSNICLPEHCHVVCPLSELSDNRQHSSTSVLGATYSKAETRESVASFLNNRTSSIYRLQIPLVR